MPATTDDPRRHFLCRSDLAQLAWSDDRIDESLATGSLEQVGHLGNDASDPVYAVHAHDLRAELQELLATIDKEDVALDPVRVRSELLRVLLAARGLGDANAAAAATLTADVDDWRQHVPFNDPVARTMENVNQAMAELLAAAEDLDDGSSTDAGDTAAVEATIEVEAARKPVEETAAVPGTEAVPANDSEALQADQADDFVDYSDDGNDGDGDDDVAPIEPDEEPGTPNFGGGAIDAGSAWAAATDQNDTADLLAVPTAPDESSFEVDSGSDVELRRVEREAVLIQDADTSDFDAVPDAMDAPFAVFDDPPVANTDAGEFFTAAVDDRASQRTDAPSTTDVARNEDDVLSYAEVEDDRDEPADSGAASAGKPVSAPRDEPAEAALAEEMLLAADFESHGSALTGDQDDAAGEAWGLPEPDFAATAAPLALEPGDGAAAAETGSRPASDSGLVPSAIAPPQPVAPHMSAHPRDIETEHRAAVNPTDFNLATHVDVAASGAASDLTALAEPLQQIHLALLTLAEQPRLATDLRPVGEALEQGFCSMRDGLAASNTAKEVASRIDRLIAAFIAGNAAVVEAIDAHRRAAATAERAMALAPAATHPRSTAATLAPVLLMVLGWVGALWLHTGDPRTAMLALVGANVIGCVALMLRRR